MTKIPSKINKPLHLGSRGPLVRTLEKKLKQQGLLKGPVDGFFDAKTKAAVKRFEDKKGWKKDGVVGNRLWRAVTGQKPQNVVKPGGGGQTTPSQKDGAFKTVSINIKSNPVMPQAKVIADVKKASKQGDLIGWQEIGPARYFDAIKELGPEWGHYMPKDGKLRIPIPISWKKSEFTLVDSGFQRTHNGLAKVSPHRYITWVKLKHKETGQEVVRINTHLVSGAWNAKKQATDPWRQAKWNIHMKKLDAMVERFQKQGLNVIVGGDFNRDSYKVLGNDVKYDNNLHVGTHGKSTLDYVMHVQDKDIATKGSKVVKGFHSDHDAVVVKYRLTGK